MAPHWPRGVHALVAAHFVPADLPTEPVDRVCLRSNWRQPGVASAFPGLDVPSGALACGGRRAARSTNELPLGPACTAWCNALPSRSSDQLRNQTVQPSPHVPARGLPVIVTGSPGTASL